MAGPKLQAWLDYELARARSYQLLDVEAEARYREALSGTVIAAFLRLEDAADSLRQPFRFFAQRKVGKTRRRFGEVRDESLRDWFRRYW